MSRPVYTESLFLAHEFSGDHIYTPPAGYRVVIRDVSWYVAEGLSAGYFFVAVGLAAGLYTTVDWFTVDVDTTVMHHQELRVAVPDGYNVLIHSDDASDVALTGYLLSLP